MKRTVLFCVGLMLTTLGAFAQWTKPAAADYATAVDMADDGATTQFLYNKGAAAFFCGHNDWNTRASVDERGDSIRMKALDGGTWNIQVYPAAYANKNAWLYLSCNGATAMWVDAGNATGNDKYPGTDKWVVEKNANGTYKITNTTVADLTPGTFGVDLTSWGETNNTRVYIKDAAAETTYTTEDDEEVTEKAYKGEFYDEWIFVSVESYKAYTNAYDAYDAANSLKTAIDDAKEKYAGIDLSAQEAVYNTSTSTVDELKAAEAAIAPAIIALLKDKASAANPVDFSSSIVNATFDTVGNFDGWSGTAFGAGGTTSTNAEHYGKTFDTYQELSGLPSGVYMVACNGYTRYQNASADYDAWKAGIPAETKIYLKGATYGQFDTPVKHVSEGGSVDAAVGAGSTATVTYTDEDGVKHTLYTPNTMAAANDYFHNSDNNDRYRNEAFGPVGEGDVLRIGLVNQKATGSDWSIFDDFQLFYYGDDADAYKLWGDAVKKNNTLDFEEVYYGIPEKELYDNAMAAIDAALEKTDKAELIADISKAIQNMSVIADTIALSKKNYAAYKAAYDDALEFLNGDGSKLAGDDVEKLDVYIQSYADENDDYADYGFPNGLANFIVNFKEGEYVGRLSAAEIAAETAYLQELKQNAIKNGSVEGADVTNLLVNASFADGFNGWTKPGAGNVGGLKDVCPNVEVYEGVVNIYQEVEDVQDGIYAISVQAFERPAGNGSYTGEEAPKVFLFMNDVQTPVQNIVKDAVAESDAVDLENCYITQTSGAWPYDYNVEGHGWVPNSMDGASYAFGAGRYTQECFGLVNNGKMKIGLTSNGVAAHWVLWANFKLTFQGKNPEYSAPILAEKVKELKDSLDAYGDDLTTPVLDAAEKVYDEGNGLTSADGRDQLWEALNATIQAIADTKANIAAVDAYNDAVAALDVALDKAEAEVPNFTGTGAYKAYEAAESEIDGYAELTTESLNNLVAKIKEITNAVLQAKGANASDESPIDLTDLIANPSYENANSEGWEGSVPNHSGYNRKDMVEYYQAIFDHHQTLKNLAAGTYELSVNCFNRVPSTNAQVDLDSLEAGAKAKVQTAFVYATVGDKTYAEPFRLISEGARAAWTLEGSNSTITSEATKATLYTPNNMTAAGACFEETDEDGNPLSDEQNYVVRVVFTLDEAADVTIGAKNSSNATWAIWDNWKLTYFGEASQKTESGDATPVIGIADKAVKANGKYLENGRIVIVKNGVKYNVAGQILK